MPRRLITPRIYLDVTFGTGVIGIWFMISEPLISPHQIPGCPEKKVKYSQLWARGSPMGLIFINCTWVFHVFSSCMACLLRYLYQSLLVILTIPAVSRIKPTVPSLMMALLRPPLSTLLIPLPSNLVTIFYWGW